jgi:hypothetical protein
MLKNITRAKLILAWFGVVALMIAAIVVFGVSMTLATGVLLVALCLVPPGIILMLWPGVPPPSVGDVLRNNR